MSIFFLGLDLNSIAKGQGMAKVYNDGPAPVIKDVAEEIGITEVVDNLVTWDSSQCKLSPGQRVTSLLMNTLEGRSPLYKMESYMDQKDVQKLFGDGIQARHFNDDALGRALDKLYETGPAKLFGSVVSRVLADEDLRIDSLHGDTTSVPVHGQFPDAIEENLNITHGHSKDNRPDLKQFKYGLVVTPDGVPVEGTVDGGNESDKTWNYELLKRLGENLPDQQEMPVYVGDSQLPTKKNLKRMDRRDIDFISRLPGTYKLDEQLKKEAVTEGEFEQIGTVSDRKGAAEYRMCPFEQELYGISYRFIVVHSPSLADRKEEAVAHELTEIRGGIQEEKQELEEREFACRPDAREALQNFVDEHESPFFEVTGEVSEEERRKKRDGPGRPPKDWEPEYETVYRVEIEIDQKEGARELKHKMDSCFVLITSVTDREERTDQEVLEEYKNQTKVETQFATLKDPKKVGPVYLNTPERIKALAYVFLLSLLVYSIIQYRVREALKEEEEPMYLVGGAKSDRPTGRRVIERFAQMKVVSTGGGKRREFPDNLEVPERVFDLVGVDVDVYLDG
jgi:transposase